MLKIAAFENRAKNEKMSLLGVESTGFISTPKMVDI